MRRRLPHRPSRAEKNGEPQPTTLLTASKQLFRGGADSAPDEYGYVDPGIEKKDYGGRTFTIVYPNWSLYNDYYFAEEYDGDIVNDSIYDRAKYVEERLGIEFVYYCPGYIHEVFPTVQKTVLAGSPDYDLALTHCATNIVSYPKEGIVLDWNALPGVDLDKPYWNQSVREISRSTGYFL